MKKIVIVLLSFSLLQACNPSNENPGESGVVNDGIGPIDENGALADTMSPNVDTLNPDRRDIQQRDTIRR